MISSHIPGEGPGEGDKSLIFRERVRVRVTNPFLFRERAGVRVNKRYGDHSPSPQSSPTRGEEG
jgi:hypothetical protein